MERVEGMEILAARLASFEAAHPAPKRRASSAKFSKSLAWPHESPSPAELAHAGFFFKPSSSSPDNTVCFLCGKYLDGWEQDDNPVQEHVKHSPDCGWAIMTSMERLDGGERTAEDPTGSRMMDARRSTFLSIWPHEGKRGWTCKTEKMVEAGWYFCPTQESDDFVTCAYCNLCLDGWEPKDDPFYEHQNRSPHCRFFTFATKPTSKRSRKARASKSSRLSTQSNVTTVSESLSIPDLDISIDQSGLSDISVTNSTMSAPKKSKKSSRVKAHVTSTSAKNIRVKERDHVEVNRTSIVSVDHGQSQPELSVSGAGRGKKRKSDEMSVDGRDREDRESTVKPQRPQKRRTTRNGVAERQIDSSVLGFDHHADEGAITENEGLRTVKKNQKSKKGGRKRGTSASRKSSIASKTSLRSDTLRDSDLEAALEADLDRPLTADEEAELLEAQDKRVKMSRDRGSSVSTVARPKQKTGMHGSRQEELQPADLFERRTQDPALADAQRMPTRRTRGSVLSVAASATRPDTDMESSVVTARTTEDDSGHETDASMTSKSNGLRKGGKRKAGEARKGRPKKGTKANLNDKAPMGEDDLPASNEGVEGSTDANARQREEASVVREPSEHPVKAKRGPKGSRTKPAGQDAMKSQELSAISPDVADRLAGRPGPRGPSMMMSSPLKQTTPSPSPQASDAENRPPSSRPTTSRPPVFSPSAQQTTRVPLAPSTPTNSSSKRNAMGSLQSSFPWKAVDLENVFSVANENKENAVSNFTLTSAEKAMTVEEWVSWNAQNGEEKLRKESERLVSIFEREGGRAMRTLEGIECIE